MGGQHMRRSLGELSVGGESRLNLGLLDVTPPRYDAMWKD